MAKDLNVERSCTICPMCDSPTNTYRHPGAKVWCSNPKCGYVLREEGEGIPPQTPMITITLKEYLKLKEDSTLLNALEGAGVDNWEGYDSAIEALEGKAT